MEIVFQKYNWWYNTQLFINELDIPEIHYSKMWTFDVSVVVCLGDCGYLIYTITTHTRSPEHILTQADVTPIVTI